MRTQIPQVKSDAFKNRIRREEGQALVEYALVLMLVALVTVGAVTLIGVNVSTAITNMANGL
jgi:pilus assembly protein Flp/PilA